MPKIDKKESTAVDKMVGRRIKARRLVLQLSQQTVATQLGVSFQQLQKYENGENRLVVSRLHQLCTILKVPADYFFGEIEDAALAQLDSHGAGSDTPHDMFSRQSVKLMHAFSRIKNPKTRLRVTGLVEQIAESEGE